MTFAIVLLVVIGVVCGVLVYKFSAYDVQLMCLWGLVGIGAAELIGAVSPAVSVWQALMIVWVSGIVGDCLSAVAEKHYRRR